MKNQRGFTLIELILTIGVMAMIGIVIATNMTGLFSKNEEENYDKFIKSIEDSACIYVEVAMDKNACKSSGACSITIGQLIERGYVDENKVNPRTGEAIDLNDTVSVSWPSGVKTCKYNIS